MAGTNPIWWLPGEDILTTVPGDEYIEKSGTSLATPFVSGAAAQLLHAHPELIGKPEDVKRILMMSCRDLNRWSVREDIITCGALRRSAVAIAATVRGFRRRANCEERNGWP